MEKFGFSAGFIAKIKVLYSEVESVLKVNGNLFAEASSRAVLRPGCSILSLEPLLNEIGFNIEGLI